MATSATPPPDRGAAIFISYRRKDSAAYARGIAERLGERYGSDRVFMDLRIPPGMDFVQSIHEGIRSAGVILVVIGPGWMVDRATGENRLHHGDDYVALEVSTALADKDVVIPVLVGGATMPARADLPEAVRPLATREALEITDQRWDYDVGRLIKRVAEILPPPPEPPKPTDDDLEREHRRRRNLLIGAIAAVAVIGGVVGAVALSGGGGDGGGGGGGGGQTPTGGPSLGSRVLDEGSKGPDVLALEQRLDQLGFNVYRPDDQFTSRTTAAVTAFQLCWGLPDTGRVGPDMVTALETTATIGTDGPDTFTGTSGNDIYFGLDGDDTIDGGGGADRICAGGGDDTVRGGAGDDRLYGGADDDTLSGDEGDDVLIGFKGSDQLDGGDGSDRCETDSSDPPPVSCER